MPSVEDRIRTAERKKRFYLRFGERLKSIREQQGITQKELAARINCNSPSFICEIETIGKGISLFDAWRLATFLHVRLTDLISPPREKKERGKKRET